METIADAVISVGSNEKLLRILGELEKPVKSSSLKINSLTKKEMTSIPSYSRDNQYESKSSSVFVEGFTEKLPSHRWSKKQIKVGKNKYTSPSADFLLDSTKCYGHREAYNMPRSVSEKLETNAIRNLYKKSLKNSKVKKEYNAIKNKMEEGIHPVNLSQKSTYVSATKVLVKKPQGRYIVDVSETSVDILGLCGRMQNMPKFEYLMNKIYNLDLKGY